MPNWCANNVTINHDDPAKLNELVDAYKRGELMEHFMPTPRDPNDPTKLLGEGKPITFDGSEDWYSWRVRNWVQSGTLAVRTLIVATTQRVLCYLSTLHGRRLLGFMNS